MNYPSITPDQDSTSRRLKRAELLGGVGAVILGMGIGLFFTSLLESSKLWLLLVGFLAHAWGMLEKRRLERKSAATRIWWSELLYWSCWAAMVILFAYIAIGYRAK